MALKLLENKDVILRIAAIKPDDFIFLSSNECSFYQLEKEQLSLEKNIKSIAIIIDSVLYDFINKIEDTDIRKKCLKLKRKVQRLKNIDSIDVPSIISVDSLKEQIDKYIYLRMKFKKVQNLKRNSFYISDFEIKHLIDIYMSNKSILDRALCLSSLNYLNELNKFIEEKSKKISNKKTNDLIIALYKYLTRATYKTSPFSFFCFQGNARLMASSSTNFNYNEYNKDLYETQASFSLINPGLEYDDLYEVNKNIWIDEKYIKILKKENVNHRNLVINNKNKLIKIEYNQLIEGFIVKYENKVLDYKQLYKVIESFFSLPGEEVDEYIDLMIEAGVLEIKSYRDLERVNPPKLKNIVLGNDRKKILNNLNDEEKGAKNIYEDVYLKKIVNFNRFQLEEQEMKSLNKLVLLFDDSIILQYKFIEYIGETKEISMIELIELLYDFEDKKEEISNKQIANIISLRNELINEVKINIHHNRETILSEHKIKKIYSTMNYFSRKPYSYTYFIQPLKNNFFVLNNIYSGYGRMFTKLKDSDYNQKVIMEMHKRSLENSRFDYLDLYGLYGFNANVHPIVTKHTLDLENIFNGGSLKDLSLRVNYETKELEFYFKDYKVLPINLSSISSRMLPILHRFLCDVNHLDSINLDLNRKAAYRDWVEITKSRTNIIPRVKTGDIILSRNKWILNIEKYNNHNNEMDFYSQLIRDVETGKIPFEFYVRPIDVKNINNLDQMNDVFKPQYINLKILTSYKLLFRIVKKCNFLLLEECLPNAVDRKDYVGDFLNTTFELGVESYFSTMDNN